MNLLLKSRFNLIKQKVSQKIGVSTHAQNIKDPNFKVVYGDIEEQIRIVKQLHGSVREFVGKYCDVAGSYTNIPESLEKVPQFKAMAEHDVRTYSPFTQFETEMNGLIINPIQKRLDLWADLRTRVNEREILFLEVQLKNENLLSTQDKHPLSNSLSSLQDDLCGAQRDLDVISAPLLDDLREFLSTLPQFISECYMKFHKHHKDFIANLLEHLNKLPEVEILAPTQISMEPVEVPEITENINAPNEAKVEEDIEERGSPSNPTVDFSDMPMDDTVTEEVEEGFEEIEDPSH
eukprot:TRINITY_DN615400_c6_g1_i1.p1 TRINITY_DN615400_c6_g1~~TRINITY_DN615400_c6_g1_i1.p1  ORF type:complete len:301 (+),score=91.36 TRINITY_DN615400_c6_g1_i1:29-904(+)